MRRLYREQKWVCGDYLDVAIYPVYKKAGQRRRRAKPTSEVQAKLNQYNAERQLCRVMDANFTDEDVEVHLTFRDDCLPEGPEEVMRVVQNWIRRVKRRRAKLGLADMKYIIVPGGGYEGTRFHLHVVMSGGMDRCELERLWGMGYANSRQLQPSVEHGFEGLSKYLARQYLAHPGEKPFGKRWTGSRNLIIPEPHERDGRLSQKKVKELATVDIERREPFERLYEGYRLASVRPVYNEVNGGWYIRVRMYRDRRER